MRDFSLARIFSISVLAILTGCSNYTPTSTYTPTPTPTPAAASTPTGSGTFTDAPVVGLVYTTSEGYTGTTNALGQFLFNAGDTVKFTAEGVLLGSFAPTVAADGSATVTPLNLTGATSVTDPKVTVMAQYLSTLNAISVATNSSSSGVYTLPSSTTLATQLTALNVTGATITVAQIQGVLDSVYGAGKYTVTDATDAQNGLQQGVNSVGIAGTTWVGTCTCGGGGTFYFQADGTINGFTADGKLLSGSWSGSLTASGGVSLSLFSSGGGYSQGGSIAAGASTGTAQIYNNTGTLQGTLTFTKVVSSMTITTSSYVGGWYVAETPTVSTNHSGSAYLIAAPDGTISGLTNDGHVISGTWSVATGIGSGTTTGGGGTTDSFSVNFATGTGSVSSGGQTVGTLAFKRTGTFSVNPSSGSTSVNTIPLLLNMTISWANQSNTANSIAVSISVTGTSGNQVASGVKATSEPPNGSGVRSSTTDNISVSYPQGGGATYSLSIGQQPCSITSGGSGAINDANSGNAGAYPTVNITCN